MTKLDKIEMIQLFDLYKGILTDKQCEMLHLFYECDFSLGEIAEQYSISRQAVHDSLSKAESALLVTEQKLCFYKQNRDIENLAQEAISTTNTSDKDTYLQQIISIVRV